MTTNDKLTSEIEALKHDLERQIALANEYMRENERLRSVLETCDCGAAEALSNKHTETEQEKNGRLRAEIDALPLNVHPTKTSEG